MSTQIDNVVTSFNDVLLQTSNLFDELCVDKTSNLVVPNQSRPTESLNEAVRTFNRSLDSLAIQLNDIAVFEVKIQQQAVEREQQKLRDSQLAEQKKLQGDLTPPQQKQLDEPLHAAMADNTFNNESNNILDDINDFLSTVPDSGELEMSGDFNDNIQQLLMENGGDYNNDGLNMADFGIDPADNGFKNNNQNQMQGQNQNQNQNQNGNGQNNGDQFDASIFSEIDSMLNI